MLAPQMGDIIVVTKRIRGVLRYKVVGPGPTIYRKITFNKPILISLNGLRYRIKRCCESDLPASADKTLHAKIYCYENGTTYRFTDMIRPGTKFIVLADD
jgi:hypothetical protein